MFALIGSYYTGDEGKAGISHKRWQTASEACDACESMAEKYPNADFDVVRIRDDGTWTYDWTL